MKDFRDLIVWQKAMGLFDGVVKDVEDFPGTEVARIISNQVLRSISSISANIAEGFGRRRGKEYEHYLYISRGSANESIDWYEKLKRLNYISANTFAQRVSVGEEIRAMLTTMINKQENQVG
ncbi:MAG: four helix bundle protein [Candidatus Loosdrechtia sp.]|uniref:four helix bundle protein n=1 Tax=Candidatus Loosdrechtia sp. TaxID=3101272 RepID=UPI003A618BA5|nr:MAG: four helix bundle protein [Candidatus Jettenia sp. AMX2]